MLPPYAELHCLSNFSFLHGASQPEELVTRAHQLGYSALAIADECSLAGVVRAHLQAKALKMPLLIGAQFSLARLWPKGAGQANDLTQASHNAQAEQTSRPGQTSRLVLLARNRNGYGNLSELITRARMRAEKGHYQLLRQDLTQGMSDCVALLAPEPWASIELLVEQASFIRAVVGSGLFRRACGRG